MLSKNCCKNYSKEQSIQNNGKESEFRFRYTGESPGGRNLFSPAKCSHTSRSLVPQMSQMFGTKRDWERSRSTVHPRAMDHGNVKG